MGMWSLRVCVFVVVSMLVVEALQLPPGVRTALYGDVVRHSDFVLNIRPPEERPERVKLDLDDVMAFEVAKQKIDMNQFAVDKQHMVNAETSAMSSLVASALEPLMARVKAATDRYN